MAEQRRGRRARGSEGTRHRDENDSVAEESKREAPPAERDEDTERALGRFFALGVPVLGLVSALAVGFGSGLARALLVLAGTALLGTIGFLWASLRVLSGEAKLSGVALHGTLAGDLPAKERKREALRALKDLELEHDIGKIDDADYRALEARYRTAAKQILREMDEDLAPKRERAEALVERYLAKHDLSPETAPEETATDDPPKAEAASGRACPSCGLMNDLDASFCKKCGSKVAAPLPSVEASDASS